MGGKPDRRAARRAHEADSSITKLTPLDAELETARQQIVGAEDEQKAASGKLGGVSSRISDAGREQRDAWAVLAEPGCEGAREHFAAIGLLAKAGH